MRDSSTTIAMHTDNEAQERGGRQNQGRRFSDGRRLGPRRRPPPAPQLAETILMSKMLTVPSQLASPGGPAVPHFADIEVDVEDVDRAIQIGVAIDRRHRPKSQLVCGVNIGLSDSPPPKSKPV